MRQQGAPAERQGRDAGGDGAGSDTSLQLPFPDRRAAGRALGARLGRVEAPALVLGLPRGGVPVGYEVALATGADLDVFPVRKLGTPGHPELAMGAVAAGGVRVLNPPVLRRFRVGDAELEAATEAAVAEVRRLETSLREGWPGVPVAGHHCVLVDDGLATGATMAAALAAVRRLGAATAQVAVPVAPADVCARLAQEADGVTCLFTPEPFEAVGLWYLDFSPVSEGEVRELLRAARETDRRPRSQPAEGTGPDKPPAGMR
jgi:putative phosphoribosyl transferase